MMNQYKYFAALISACLLAPVVAAAQATTPVKPITHETLWMMKRVGTPAVSPDGKWVVFSVLEPSYETDKAVSDLWLTPTDGLKPPRRLTSTKAPEDDVHWSPMTYAANWKTPMLLSIGERDFRVPIGNTLENWSTLQRMHVPSRLLVWPDARHWITKAEDSRHFYDEVHHWLATYLQDTARAEK